LQLKNLFFAFALISLAGTVGCGSSNGGGIVIPSPSGNFSNASLSGSYVYEVHGFDTAGNPYRQIGVFTADGNGHITGGSDDSTVSSSATQVTGSYTISKDGTGFIGVNTSLGQVSWAVTLVSSSKLQLIEADTFANAAGTAERQDTTAATTTPAGTFVFRLHQEISAQSQAPASEVGAVTFSGGSGSGTMDENLAGVFSAPAITATIASPVVLGRGTGTLVNSGTTFSTKFVYYIVNSSKFFILVSSLNSVGSGSAELQSGAVTNGLSGNYVFGSRGDDSQFFAGVATAGQFSATGGTISGTEDSSQDGTISSNVSFASCYTASANGRVVVTSSSGGTCTSPTSQVFWMVSPARAFFVNNAGGSVEDGTADLQQSQSFSASTFTNQYSLVMDGVDLVNGQLLSRVGSLQFDGIGKITLNEVANASGTGSGTNSPGLIVGTYSVSSSGRIVGTMNAGTLNLVMYAISPSQAYVLQSDTGFVTSGQIQLQQ
jgi:hypothetical protein